MGQLLSRSTQSTAQIPILILGATGYIGGSVLSRLLAHPDVERFEITALVRSAEKAERLRELGVKTVIGSTDDAEKLETLASQAHIVFSMVDADDLAAIQTILRGLKKRHDTSSDIPILIHTSGAAVLGDQAKGLHDSDVIYDDTNFEQIEALPPSQPHHDVDIAIVEADKQGYLKSYIVVPSLVHGIASGPLVDIGIQNPFSMQIPGFILAGLDRGQVGMVGEGRAIWSNVHIDDVANLFLVLFDTILSNPEKVGHGSEGYFFAENGEHTWYDLSKAIGEALVQAGLSKDSEPTSLTDDELIKYTGSVRGEQMGTNARCRANKARALGWNPTKTSQDMFDGLNLQVDALVKAMQAKQQKASTSLHHIPEID
ncbi:unnamed protein product [Somion occarium]|uniref:Semialdehyde dehydrogenase NAD-binding domain-containing protein n=1 Tax=Somion occarium TaxID=3059160 RepID=A0ABP1D4Q6_9APHY